MKILILPSWYPNRNGKTAGIFFQKQAELLSTNHDVRIMAAEEILSGYRKLPGKIGSLLKVQHKPTNFYLDQVPKAKLHQFAFDNFAFLSESRRMNRLADAYAAYVEQELEGDWMPDIIHAHDTFYGGLVASRLKTVWKIPYVITSHNPINSENWSAFRIAEFRRVLKHADLVTAVSEFDRENLLNAGGQDINIKTIGNYIDDDLFVPVRKIKQEEFHFLYIASTSLRKDFGTIIRSMSILRNLTELPFKLKLASVDVRDGITLEDVRDLVNHYNLNDIVSIESDLALKSGLLPLLQGADLFVSSSYYETFGVAVAEAMCCGVPAIAADNGGVRDVVQPGINGSLVPVKSPDLMAAAILKFMNGELNFDPQLVRSSIVNRYGTKAYLGKLTSIYENILA